MIKNIYGNVCGVHTPRMTELNKRRIEKATKLEFEDSSWHKDLCDSISNEHLNLQIWLPNSVNQNLNEEEYNTYTISSYDGEDMYMEHLDKMYSFLQVIDVISTINRNTMHKFNNGRDTLIEYGIITKNELQLACDLVGMHKALDAVVHSRLGYRSYDQWVECES